MGGAASTPVPAELKRDEALALVAQHFDTLAAGAETVARDKLAASLAALTCAPSGAGDTTGAGAADTSSGAKEDATRGAAGTGDAADEEEYVEMEQESEDEDVDPTTLRNYAGDEEPHSAAPDLYNIDGTVIDLCAKYKAGGQLWYLQSRAKEAIAGGKEVNGERISQGPSTYPGLSGAGGGASVARRRRASTEMKKFLSAVDPDDDEDGDGADEGTAQASAASSTSTAPLKRPALMKSEKSFMGPAKGQAQAQAQGQAQGQGQRRRASTAMKSFLAQVETEGPGESTPAATTTA